MNGLNNIRIVLVETSHPGNIGAAARAMKTMCLDRLVLVKPKFYPDDDATARASGADDVLAKAMVCDSLQDALAGARLVIGTTARSRSMQWPLLDPRECAGKVLEESPQGDVALVFGRERSGLTNAELDLCHYAVQIPCNPDYSSLNLAAAVQVLCYEIMMASTNSPSSAEASASVNDDDEPLATAEQVEQFFQHLEAKLIELEFLDPQNPRLLMRRLRRLYNRVRLSQNEVNILRGILTESHAKIRKR